MIKWTHQNVNDKIFKAMMTPAPVAPMGQPMGQQGGQAGKPNGIIQKLVKKSKGQ